MHRAITFITIVIGTTALLAQSRSTTGASATVERVAKALGLPSATATPPSVEFSATGGPYTFGQSFRPGGPWPPFKVTKYQAIFDDAIPASRVEVISTNPDGPNQGGGAVRPLLEPRHTIQVVAGSFAWNESVQPGGASTPANNAAAGRRFQQVWLSPLSLIHAIGVVGDKATVESQRGRTVISFPAPNSMGFTIKATINADNLPEMVEWLSDDPVLGDVVTDTTYGAYRDFNGIKFPMRITQKEGGSPVLDLTIAQVRTGEKASFDVPANVRAAAANPPAPLPGPEKVDVQKLSDGVWLLLDRPIANRPNSVAVEFADYVMVIEAPLNEIRTTAVFDTVKRLVPNKPIRYVVGTHTHFDHSGGIRTAVA